MRLYSPYGDDDGDGGVRIDRTVSDTYPTRDAARISKKEIFHTVAPYRLLHRACLLSLTWLAAQPLHLQLYGTITRRFVSRAVFTPLFQRITRNLTKEASRRLFHRRGRPYARLALRRGRARAFDL